VPRNISRCKTQPPFMFATFYVYVCMCQCVCVCTYVCVGICAKLCPAGLTFGASSFPSLGGVGKSCLTGEWSPPIDMGISCSPPPVESSLSKTSPEPWST
jgi:hypothetical protein